ncbi:AAA domain containing protein [uncultured Caudovirales phage]|uniref:AAA domain containing protein n=1 Tax=uncultured Caudovirales phage TaxID=2100421 RepID=A0A6J5L340_9CAUD|nr:AAA domain containing protein [uncultured Caudovirales phage]CAB5219792.1 AAA domain containing protein [uncultured Caudovirales phage]
MYKPDELPARRRTWVKTANVPPAKIGWTLDDCKDVPADTVAAVNKWIKALYSDKIIRAEGKETCGLGLMLYGLPGRGKTTVANAIIQDIIRNVDPAVVGMGPGKAVPRPCYFITYNSLLELKGDIMDYHENDDELLFNGILGEAADDAYNVRVLILDDVGKEHASASGWQKNMLHHVLRTRFNNGLPTIVTTNIKIDDWEAHYGSATQSFVHEAFMYMNMDSITDLRK